MELKEAIALYREYKKISEKEFGFKVFMSEEGIKKLEQTGEISIDDLLKLYKFFSLTIIDNDPQEIHIKNEIGKIVTREIRKRTGE